MDFLLIFWKNWKCFNGYAHWMLL